MRAASQTGLLPSAAVLACCLAGLAARVHAIRGIVYQDLPSGFGALRPVKGALVKAYDNDLVGKQFMGEDYTNEEGKFAIRYDDLKCWDLPCIASDSRPDIMFEVWIDGALVRTTAELATDYRSGSGKEFLIDVPPDRTIAGSVRWADPDYELGHEVEGAVVQAWDVDGSSRQLMGASAVKYGRFEVTSSNRKLWDGCCGLSSFPDVQLEVYVKGRLWHTTSVTMDAPLVLTYKLNLSRIWVTGRALWHETCGPAAGLSVQVWDADFLGREFMGAASTNSLGYFEASVNPRKGGKQSWDSSPGAAVNPDVYVEFLVSAGGRQLGRSSVRQDVAVPPNSSERLKLGTTYLWRGDPAEAAAATEAALKISPVDWVEVEEYPYCATTTIRVKIVLNFKRGSNISDVLWAQLKALAKTAIYENWSRKLPGQRVQLADGKRYAVLAEVAERSSGLPVELQRVTEKECKHANVTSPASFNANPVVFYNEGCARARFGSGWEAQAAYEFKEWMAHEVGHAVLRAAPPDSAPVVKYGAFPLTRGQSWSWTHKGSSSIYQTALPTTPAYPATGEIDLMLMYQGDPPPGAFDRSLAAEDDVRRLVGLAKSKHRRLTRLFSGDAVNFCDCPRLD